MAMVKALFLCFLLLNTAELRLGQSLPTSTSEVYAMDMVDNNNNNNNYSEGGCVGRSYE